MSNHIIALINSTSIAGEHAMVILSPLQLGQGSFPLWQKIPESRHIEIIGIDPDYILSKRTRTSYHMYTSVHMIVGEHDNSILLISNTP